MDETPVKAVLFDYGLVLSGPPDPAARANMLGILGFDELAFDVAYWAHRHAYDRGELTGESYWRAVALEQGRTLTPEQVQALLAADIELWTQVNQPMIDWAMRLQDLGYRTGILSNLGDAMTAGVRAKFAWLARFDCAIWSYTLRLAKPEPAIYRHAAEGLGVTPGNILFVDDREVNVAAALAFGMQAIRYGAHGEFVAELCARGLERLWEPAGAART